MMMSTLRLLSISLISWAMSLGTANALDAQLSGGGVVSQFGVSSGEAGGFIFAISGEVDVTASLRAALSWTSWSIINTCAEDDFPRECGADPQTLQAGILYSFSDAPRVKPFVGLGSGIYSRDGDSGLAMSGTAGLDIVMADPLRLRFALRHQEVLSEAIEKPYNGGLRFTSCEVGLGIMLR